jgi:hypothetical protein
MLVLNKYFYKNKKSKLYFGDRVAVLNDFIYQTGGSKWLCVCVCFWEHEWFRFGIQHMQWGDFSLIRHRCNSFLRTKLFSRRFHQFYFCIHYICFHLVLVYKNPSKMYSFTHVLSRQDHYIYWKAKWGHMPPFPGKRIHWKATWSSKQTLTLEWWSWYVHREGRPGSTWSGMLRNISDDH